VLVLRRGTTSGWLLLIVESFIALVKTDVVDEKAAGKVMLPFADAQKYDVPL